MGKGIYFNVPAYGHVNPTLPLVKELVEHGEYIVYFNGERFRKIIEKSGAEFRNYGVTGEREAKGAGNFIILADRLLEASVTIMDRVLEETKEIKPDYIIHDSTCPWGKFIARFLGIKGVNTISTFVFNRETLSGDDNFARKLLVMMVNGGLGKLPRILKHRRMLSTRFGVKTSLKDLFHNPEALNLVFTSSYFQPGASGMNDSYKFVGPSIADRGETLDFSFRHDLYDKRIFISLGTVMNQNVVFYKECIKAFTGQPYEVVMAIGSKVAIEDLGELPPNMHVKKYVPQLEVLKLTDLFLSHGGMNSVNESLYFGVPLLLFPQQAEQLIVARRVESLGAGLCMNPRIRTGAEVIIQAVRRVLSNHKYAVQAEKIGGTFRYFCPDPLSHIPRACGSRRTHIAVGSIRPTVTAHSFPTFPLSCSLAPLLPCSSAPLLLCYCLTNFLMSKTCVFFNI